MIKETDGALLNLLLCDGASLPSRYPFSLTIFRKPFMKRHWYAFDETDLNTWMHPPEWIFHKDVLGDEFFSAGWGPSSSNNIIRHYELTQQDRIDLALEYPFDGRVYWNRSGLVWAHYFTDFLLTNVNEFESTALFGMSVQSIYEDVGPIRSFWAEVDHYPEENRALMRAAYEKLRQEIEETWRT